MSSSTTLTPTSTSCETKHHKFLMIFRFCLLLLQSHEINLLTFALFWPTPWSWGKPSQCFCGEHDSLKVYKATRTISSRLPQMKGLLRPTVSPLVQFLSPSPSSEAPRPAECCGSPGCCAPAGFSHSLWDRDLWAVQQCPHPRLSLGSSALKESCETPEPGQRGFSSTSCPTIKVNTHSYLFNIARTSPICSASSFLLTSISELHSISPCLLEATHLYVPASDFVTSLISIVASWPLWWMEMRPPGVICLHLPFIHFTLGIGSPPIFAMKVAVPSTGRMVCVESS